jgi:alpha-amylase
MKGGGPGDVHNYFSAMGSPVEAFAVYSRILSDLEARIRLELEKPELAAKRILRRLPAGMGFTFSYDFGHSSILAVHTLTEFASALKNVAESSLRFHAEKGDFERWIRQVIGDDKLADEIAVISNANKKLKGESLRKRLFTSTARRIRQLKRLSKDADSFEENEP